MRWTRTRERGSHGSVRSREDRRGLRGDRHGHLSSGDGGRPGRSQPVAAPGEHGIRGGPRATGPEDGPDRGSAVVEFVGLGLLLLIPIMYLVVTVARVQAGSFAVVAASEQAGQAVTTMNPATFNPAVLQEVAGVAALDHGFETQDLAVRVSCAQGACTSPGAVVTVHAQLNVQLPGVPGFLDATVATLTSDVTVIAGRYS